MADKTSINAGDMIGRTALIRAASDLDVERCRTLLAQGADPNIRCNRDQYGGGYITALEATFQRLEGYDDDKKRRARTIIGLLLDNGAKPDTEPYNPKTVALDMAVKKLELELIDALLEKGADPNRKVVDPHEEHDDRYSTILHSLVDIANHPDYSSHSHTMTRIADALIAKGADPTIVDYRNMSALDSARRQGIKHACGVQGADYLVKILETKPNWVQKNQTRGPNAPQVGG